MIYLKTPDQLNEIEYANKLVAEVLQMCYDHIKPGIATIELEYLAERFCVDNNVRPAFNGYQEFPHSVCISVNHEVIHGFPSEYVIKSGDIVSVDFGIEYNGYYGDAAFTKMVGEVSEDAKLLVETTEKCLYLGIDKAVSGNRIYDISRAIETYATDTGFDVSRSYTGHGIGFYLHESPIIPNYVSNGINWKLRAGMVIAIEPILIDGSSDDVIRDKNLWTVINKKNKLSAHFEHTVAILEGSNRILSML